MLMAVQFVRLKTYIGLVADYFEGDPMSIAPAVTMAELELERAELLPSRETLCVVNPHQSFDFTQVEYGNTAQSGLVNVAVANGSLDNIVNLGSGNIL
jgi:hypothetical protein